MLLATLTWLPGGLGAVCWPGHSSLCTPVVDLAGDPTSVRSPKTGDPRTLNLSPSGELVPPIFRAGPRGALWLRSIASKASSIRFNLELNCEEEAGLSVEEAAPWPWLWFGLLVRVCGLSSADSLLRILLIRESKGILWIVWKSLHVTRIFEE